jgi:hypothetical protein
MVSKTKKRNQLYIKKSRKNVNAGKIKYMNSQRPNI